MALYPENHPPWVTHQYVADSVMYALLKVIEKGLGCDDYQKLSSTPTVPILPKKTVATKEVMNNCFICLSPLSRIDARMPKYVDNKNITTTDDYKNTKSNYQNNEVVVTCGDWKWVTDERKRSGWQSEQYGSIIKFRLKIGKNPTISLTHMKSHQNFGKLKITLQPRTKQDASPILGCNDIHKFQDKTLIPSLSISGEIPRFSLWDTKVFPGKIDYFDVNSQSAWELLNQTVLSKLNDDIEYVDMYVMNPNEISRSRRIKIQTVTSC